MPWLSRILSQPNLINTRASIRTFCATSVINYKDISIEEEKNKITVEGKILPSPRTKYLVACEQAGGEQGCHPFCKSSIAAKVKHTDVLILDQFLDPQGQLHKRENLGMCKKQWFRLRKLVEMAQRAGLMPGKEFYAKEVRQTKWGSQNCYWDESSIDAQWKKLEQSNKRSYFLGYCQHSKPSTMSRQTGRITDIKKVSGELFSLTYGALVAQILKDYENVEEVNRQLEKMGYNIGVRIVEDYLSRTNTTKCTDFRETSEKLQQAMKMYLNVSPQITSWSPANDEFSLVFESNPVGEFVELPENCSNLKYANILCGVVRGALEMVHLEVATSFVQDNLQGDNVTELRVKFLKKIEDTVPPGDD